MTLALLSVIGSWVEWYANYAPVHGFGVTANLVYAAMAMQVIVTMLGIVFYGPVVFVARWGIEHKLTTTVLSSHAAAVRGA